MNVYSLIDRHKSMNPDSTFFSHDTLKFFGERISDMNILKDTVKITDYCGEEHECYVLSTLQRKHPLGKRRAHYYFDTTSYERIIDY